MEQNGIYNVLFSSAIESANLPKELDLTPLFEDIEQLWQNSIAGIADGVVIEYAATIVLKADGTIALTNEVRGDSSGVTPVLCVETSETFIGTFHTHPRTDGLMPMPFSADDIVSAIILGEKVSVMRSGNTIFALVKTEETATTADLKKAQNEFTSVVLNLRRRAVSILDAIWVANRILCIKYGLALYVGTINQPLKEVYKP
jgi:hypothetical protein